MTALHEQMAILAASLSQQEFGSGGLSPEDIQTAVNDYLTANPPSASAYELRGTGMPNGVVTANPGTYYTDTAGTNGAWRWLKKTGTGNTGWECVIGDTGWRQLSDIVTFAQGASTSSLGLIWRMQAGGRMAVNFTFTTDATFAGGLHFTLPAGFPGLWTGVYPQPGYQGIRWWWSGFSVYVDGSGANPARRTGEFAYLASSTAWPTTLPGSAI